MCLGGRVGRRSRSHLASVGSPEPPADLVQLTEAEHLRVLDDAHSGAGNVDSDLHNIHGRAATCHPIKKSTPIENKYEYTDQKIQ